MPVPLLRRGGAAAVEFAVVAPLMLFLLLAIIEFGRMLMVQEMLVNGAREGARRAVLTGSTNSEVQTVIESYMKSAATMDEAKVKKVSITTNPTDVSKAKSGETITVSVGVNFTDVSWLPGLNFLTTFMKDGNLPMNSTVAMRKE